METSNYGVDFEEFTTRHFVKSFEKKYKSNWIKTRDDIVEVCKRIDAMLQLQRADLIGENGSHKLVKLDFAVEGTRISPKASGNRCILHVDEELHVVRVLIVYSKNDISEPNETVKWKNVIKERFAEVRDIFSL